MRRARHWSWPSRVVAVCVAHDQLDGTDQWAFNVLTTTAITLQWEWAPKVSVPVTGLLLTAYVVTLGWVGASVPLLADLADGVLDPRIDDARRRCALAATQLRRLFAENDDVPDPLVHEVTACVHVAERRGVVVSLAVSGAPVPVPTDVRRELTGPLAVALSAARERARAGLLRTEDEVRVAVVADAGVDVGTGHGRAEVECGTYGRHTRMEARWRTS